MLTEIPIEEYRATLDRCAEDLLWEAGVDRPPVDAFAVAERLRMVVATDAAMTGRARLARIGATAVDPGRDTIVLRPEARPERRHFAVAHEIGEAHAHRVYETLGVDPREAARSCREEVADSLAGRLLAPRRWLAGFWCELDGDLAALKRVFTTASYELIARRLLAIVDTPIVVTVTDQGRVAWRRWNRSGAAPPRVRLEIDCQLRAHSTGEPAWGDGLDEPHTAAGAPVAHTSAWPVHEPGWRREVTLTELREVDSEWRPTGEVA